MATYRARMIDSATGAEGSYDFEAPDDLLSTTPVRIVRTFMEHVGKDLFPHQHVDYELNVALKHSGHDIVTAIGALVLEHTPTLPFMVMISSKKSA